MADTKYVNKIGRIQAAYHIQVNRKQLFQKHKEFSPAYVQR